MRIKMLPALVGDCIEIIIDKPRPRLIIIDGGMGRACKHLLREDITKWNQEYGPVDLAILTHIDRDHISGFLSVFSEESFDKHNLAEIWFNYGERIETLAKKQEQYRIYVKEESCNTSAQQGRELYEVIREKEICLVAPVISGVTKEYEKCRIEVISPEVKDLKEFVNSSEYLRVEEINTGTASANKDYTYPLEELANRKFNEIGVTHSNASSIAVLITTENAGGLFLADTKASDIEEALRKRGYSEKHPLKLDYLKVSHHGSAYSTSDSLIRMLDCSNYLISANWNGRPTKECLSRIVKASRNQVSFWCNYTHEKEIFTKEEYEKYGIQFIDVGKSEIELNG